MNPNSHNPFQFPEYEWNGITMIPRRKTATEIKEQIDAARGDSIYAPVHIPVEEARV